MSDDAEGKSFWGPLMWDTALVLTAAYEPSQENAQALMNFLDSYGKLIPCKNPCAKNWKAKMRKIPIEAYLNSNHDAFFLIYMCRDLVNKDQTLHHPEKPKISPPYLQVKSKFFGKLGKQCSECGDK